MPKIRYSAKENKRVGTHSYYAQAIPTERSEWRDPSTALGMTMGRNRNNGLSCQQNPILLTAKSNLTRTDTVFSSLTLI